MSSDSRCVASGASAFQLHPTRRSVSNVAAAVPRYARSRSASGSAAAPGSRSFSVACGTAPHGSNSVR
ncbi:hypothetical protein AB6O49_14645 [Streptomyces sp. SBR177]